MAITKLARLGAIATLTALMAGSVGVSPASAQSSAQSSAQLSAQSSAQSLGEASRSSLRNILRRIFRDDDETQPPAISRGEAACLIAPARPGETTVIWHDRPVLVWEGTPGKIDVFDPATDSILWEYTPTEGETHVQYDGERLQSGGRYQWRVYDPQDLLFPQSFPTFEILPLINRLLIANELSIAKNTTEDSAEAIAIAYADYFAEHDMNADALQALFAVNDPSTELKDTQSEIIATVCE